MANNELAVDLNKRLTIVKGAVASTATRKKLENVLSAANGNWSTALKELEKLDVPEMEIKAIKFAHSLAELTDDNEKVIRSLSKTANVTSLREFALANDKTTIASMITDDVVANDDTGGDLAERKAKLADNIHNKLFAVETSAVIQRMVTRAELPITDTAVRTGVQTFLNNQPEFNIRTTSVYNAIRQNNAFKGIDDSIKENVISHLKTIQRVQAISPKPETVAHLMKANVATAYHVTEMTEKDFMKTFRQKLGEDDAKMVYTNATNIKIRNEQVMVTMHEYLNDPHIAAINRSPAKPEKLRIVQEQTDRLQVPVNWEALFGGIDFCECEECASVYSPASYFVELLNYLRNNNLDPDETGGQAIKSDPKDISGTALEKLFRRRPDLGCLQLTCENTNTVIPYIDLVNEVMESFVVHLGEYHANTLVPKQATIEHWNVEDETSGELLAQPQHTNYDAYCILKKAVYPFTLPYHQPVDAIRIFLKFLETSRYELMKTFRSAGNPVKNDELPDDNNIPAPDPRPEQEELIKLHNKALDKAIDAEFLNMTQEEYIILTKQAFWEKKYFEIKCKKSFTEEEYRDKIGVKKVHEYYGYSTEAEMLSTDETQKKGLTFVKRQFLVRTGLQYVDLVELLKTKFINPAFPRGKALTILESIQFSYRFLQTLVDAGSSDPKVRFGKLIAFLEKTQPFLPLLDELLHPDPCSVKKLDTCKETKQFEKWVYCYFEKIGKLIVLESGEGPTLPIAGKLFTEDQPPQFIGTLHNDGRITDKDGVIIGNVNFIGGVVTPDGKPFVEKYGNGSSIHIIGDDGVAVGYIDKQGLRDPRENRLTWLPAKDTCDLEKVRLKHLDGSDLTPQEYDKLHRFIRLWRKMGWTIDETDKAITGLAAYKLDAHTELPTDDDCTNCFDQFRDCESDEGEDDFGCSPSSEQKVVYEITPDFIHQLAAIKKLLDSTGLELIKLLTFWTGISTHGEKALYARLFLTHNMTGIDTVFKPDNNGNYLTKEEKITDHIPVLMAAFNLKNGDVETLMEFKQIPDSLTISNITAIYRHSLLMRVISVKSYELVDIIDLFGENPFKDAHTTDSFMTFWDKIEDAGFDHKQLCYVIKNNDDEKKPFAPKKKVVLQLAKSLYDGLNQIDKDHPDLEKVDEETINFLQSSTLTDEEKAEFLEGKATEELLRSKISLLFDQTTVASIIALLQGATQYNTNAPKSLVTSNDEFVNKFPSGTDQQKRETAALIKKVKYDFTNGALLVTGILTEKQKTDLKSLFNAPDWPKAIDRVGKQALYYFNDVLSGIFTGDLVKAKEVLLQGDINLTEDEQDPMNPVANTPAIKRKYFIEIFLPFLRDQLTHRFLVDQLSAAASLDKKATDVLISDVLEETTADGPQKIIEIFKSIKKLPPAGSTGWKGYLIPTIEDNYIFAVESDTPPAAITIDGQSLVLTQQEDPSNLWLSNSIKLETGKTYAFAASGLSADLKELTWKTATSPKAPIPPSVLLPDYSAQSVETSFIKLQKAGILVTGFALNNEEISYLQQHGSDFDALDFNAVTLKSWMQLEAYVRFRNSLPETDTNLLEFFGWTSQTTDATALSEKISTLTQWETTDIDKLISASHFDLMHTEDFRNAQNLLKLQEALYVAEKIAMDIDLLFDWARPSSRFWLCHQISESIRKSIRARYTAEDWEQVVKPLNDELRNNQKNALISYLLVQQDLVDWGVTDADSLFEFFLIDVQMDACMETSRIKQAISSVQLFVQRCFLGLEAKYGVDSGVLDGERWEWMSRNVIWQANRKVFLYPENWIESDLRDDKSAFYKELESELLQKDINSQTVQDALKSYLYKVDEVANMQVVGLFVDQENDKIHVFARTRNAPYMFYYRYYNTDENTWQPWEKMQVDITSYDVEDGSGKITGNGCYLIPAVLNNRLLLFFPMILKKTIPVEPTGSITTSPSATFTKATQRWEIKLAWSEYRNNKWTQKQVSKDAVYDDNFTAINQFSFVPFVHTNEIVIGIYRGTGASLSSYTFATNTMVQGGSAPSISTLPNNFHYNSSAEIHSLQSNGSAVPMLTKEPFFITQSSTASVDLVNYPVGQFHYPYTHKLISRVNEEELTNFFKPNVFPDAEKPYAYGEDGPIFNELKKPYSIYTWEMHFHTPAVIADKLSKGQQFEEAMKWYHYIFNPLAEGLDANRAWQFYPFKKIDADNFLDQFFNSLQPNKSNEQINEWREKPFRPHVIARSRPSAYMKWIVMKYIDNLIAWGDYLYRQDTIESLNYATQLYILAYHILGPKPQLIPKRGEIKPETYNSLLGKWDAFGNAMVELELAFPFSNQTPLPIGISNGVVGLANIFGFASSLYFCIPNNDKLMGYWDTIADRLYKIRHCQNIEGVVRKLALWDPPIDPALLVNAVAQGLSLDSILNDLNTPMPNYRFNYLLQKAIELCNELKSMGSSLLSVLEKKDSEVLSKLRAGHESSIHNLVMEIKKLNLEESNKTLESLQQNRKTPVYRLQHYLKLIGEDLNKVPAENADFTELVNQLETPIEESGLKLINYEKEEMDKAGEAHDWQKAVATSEAIAAIFHIIPNIEVAGKPFGVGAGVAFGGQFLGNASQAVAKGLQIRSNDLTFQSTSSQRKGGFLRQLQDRIMQANMAGYEIKQIDKQIANQAVRQQIAAQDINVQQKQIDNAVEVEEYLKNKYTNEQLYSWMEGSVKTLYHQVYTLAYDLAKKAEKVYRFERGLSSSNFIQYAYWDAGRDGLQAGEKLYVSIKQLEAAYQEKRGYDFEVTKHISLRQVSPLALLELKEKGKCEFDLPEVLFDMDFPGHYMRRIKSVSVSIPCIAGPYTSINATLRLLENKFRVSSVCKDGKDYPEKLEETDERFSTVNIPITAIAASSGQNDSGVFDLNFKDERYLPFEGAGAVSKWRLEFPADFRQFDYDSITDAVIHMRYTSLDGGDKLKKSAGESLKTFIKSVEELSQREGLFTIFDLKHDFPNEWYKATQTPAGPDGRIISLGNIIDRLPSFTKGRQPDKIKATDITVLTTASLQAAELKLSENGDDNDFMNGVNIGSMKAFSIRDIELPLQQWELKITDTQTALDKMWLVVRYVLK